MKKSKSIFATVLSLVLLASCGAKTSSSSSSSPAVSSSTPTSSTSESTSTEKTTGEINADFNEAFMKIKKGSTFYLHRNIAYVNSKGVISGYTDSYYKTTEDSSYIYSVPLNSDHGDPIYPRATCLYEKAAKYDGVEYPTTCYMSVVQPDGSVVEGAIAGNYDTIYTYPFDVVSAGDFYVDEKNKTASLYYLYDMYCFVGSIDPYLSYSKIGFSTVDFTWDPETKTIETMHMVGTYSSSSENDIYTLDVDFEDMEDKWYSTCDGVADADLDTAIANTVTDLASNNLTLNMKATNNAEGKIFKDFNALREVDDVLINTDAYTDQYGNYKQGMVKGNNGWIAVTQPEDANVIPVVGSSSIAFSEVAVNFSKVSSKLFTKGDTKDGITYYNMKNKGNLWNKSIYAAFDLGYDSYFNSASASISNLSLKVKDSKLIGWDTTVAYSGDGVTYTLSYTLDSIGTTAIDATRKASIKKETTFAYALDKLDSRNFRMTYKDGTYVDINDTNAISYKKDGSIDYYLGWEPKSATVTTTGYVYKYTANADGTYAKAKAKTTTFVNLGMFLRTPNNFPTIALYNNNEHTISEDLKTTTIVSATAKNASTETYDDNGYFASVKTNLGTFTFSNYDTIAAIVLPTVA